jgi:hypothetical protein
MQRQIPFFAKSLVFCLPLLAAPALVMPAQADPAIVDYVCEPALPNDGHMTIDWNAGKNVILVRFPPNKQATKLAFTTSDFSFRYERGKTVVFGKGDKELSLQMGKNPLRICTRTGPFREQHSPEIKEPPKEEAPADSAVSQ